MEDLEIESVMDMKYLTREITIFSSTWNYCILDPDYVFTTC